MQEDFEKDKCGRTTDATVGQTERHPGGPFVRASPSRRTADEQTSPTGPRARLPVRCASPVLSGRSLRPAGPRRSVRLWWPTGLLEVGLIPPSSPRSGCSSGSADVGRILAEPEALVAIVRIGEILLSPLEERNDRAVRPLGAIFDVTFIAGGPRPERDRLSIEPARQCPGRPAGSGRRSSNTLAATRTAADLIGDVPIDRLKRSTSGRIAVVNQQPFLYSRSIRENIAITGGDGSGRSRRRRELSTRSAASTRATRRWSASRPDPPAASAGGGDRPGPVQQPQILVLDDALSAVDTESDILQGLPGGGRRDVLTAPTLGERMASSRSRRTRCRRATPSSRRTTADLAHLSIPRGDGGDRHERHGYDAYSDGERSARSTSTSAELPPPRPSHRRWAFMMCAGFGLALVETVIPLLTGWMIDEITNGSTSRPGGWAPSRSLASTAVCVGSSSSPRVASARSPTTCVAAVPATTASSAFDVRPTGWLVSR